MRFTPAVGYPFSAPVWLKPAGRFFGIAAEAPRSILPSPIGHLVLLSLLELSVTQLTASAAIRNTLVILIGQFTGRLLDLLTILVIARHYGEEQYGQFSFAFAYVGYFAVLADMGFGLIFVREMARSGDRAAALLSCMMVAKLVLVIISSTLAAVFVLIPGYPEATVHLVWIALIGLMVSPKLPSVRTVYEQLFQSRLRMSVPVIIRLFEGLLLLLMVLIATNYEQSMKVVVTLFVISFLPGLFGIYYLSRKLVIPSEWIDFPLLRSLFKSALPLGLLGAIWVMNGRIDVFFLSIWRTDSEIGYYSAAYRLTEAMRLLPSAVMMSVYPLLSQLARELPNSFSEILDTSVKVQLIIAIPVCFLLCVLAQPIIAFLYTPAFLPAAGALSILVWTELAIVLTMSLSQTLIALNHRTVVIWISAGTLAVTICLNVFLIPTFGYLAASGITVVSEMVGVVGYAVAVSRITGWSVLTPIFRVAPAAGGLVISWWAIQSLDSTGAVFGGIAAYGAGLWFCKAITLQEARIFLQSFPRLSTARRNRNS